MSQGAAQLCWRQWLGQSGPSYGGAIARLCTIGGRKSVGRIRHTRGMGGFRSGMPVEFEASRCRAAAVRCVAGSLLRRVAAMSGRHQAAETAALGCRVADSAASGRFRAADSEFEQPGTECQTKGRPWSTRGTRGQQRDARGQQRDARGRRRKAHGPERDAHASERNARGQSRIPVQPRQSAGQLL